MSGIGWAITGVIYLVLICTLCILSFRKGHWVLGLIGFIFPGLVAGRSHPPGPPPALIVKPGEDEAGAGGRIRNAVNPATRLACAVPVRQLRAAQVH
jgi:hypothetical protein